MSYNWILAHAFLPILYAAAATVALAAASVGLRFRLSAQAFLTLFLVLAFLCLSQFPLPTAGSLNCPVSAGAPRLTPLRFVGDLVERWRQDPSVLGLLKDHAIAEALANVVLCGAIGISLSRYFVGLRITFLLGTALSLMVELTQLTGIWGVYPCPFRTFDVNDIMLNVLGTAAGSLLGRFLGRRV